MDAFNRFFLFKQSIKPYFYTMQYEMYKDSLYIGKIISVVAKLRMLYNTHNFANIKSIFYTFSTMINIIDFESFKISHSR